MASQQLANFCKVLIRDVYGDLASQVLGALFDYGRLNAQQLSKKTKLPLLTVQRTLIPLVQNRFITHWTEKSSKKQETSTGVTHYMANWREIYAVLWSGPIFEQVSELYNGDEIILQALKNFHVYGHMKVSDYLESSSNTAGSNEQPSESPSESHNNSIMKALTVLVAHKVLIPLKAYDFCSEPDIYQQYLINAKKDVVQNGQVMSETARQKASVAKASDDVEKLYLEKYLPGAGLIENKQKAEVSFSALSLKPDDITDTFTVEDDAVLAVNHEKFLLTERNKQLVKFCNNRLGPMTAKVFQCILQCYEDKLYTCKQQVHYNEKYRISTMEIAKRLDKSLDLTSAFHTSLHKRRSSSSAETRPKRIKTENGAFSSTTTQDSSSSRKNNVIELSDDDADEDEGDSDHDITTPTSSSSGGNGSANGIGSYQALKQHLELLSTCSVPFLKRPENGTPDTWWVPFPELSDSLRQCAYDRIIEQRYGHLCSRILRVVREQKKVSEPVLSRMSLVSSVELRSCLAQLEYIGCLDLQEVSRGNDRAPSRTFYFWYHSSKRAYTLLLENMYNTMLNLYTLLLSERLNNSVLLSKLEREDVKGHEDAYLSVQEKREFNELKKREERILTQIFRLDNMVRIFRDY